MAEFEQKVLVETNHVRFSKPFALVAYHVAYNPLPRLLFISSTLLSKTFTSHQLTTLFPIVSPDVDILDRHPYLTSPL